MISSIYIVVLVLILALFFTKNNIVIRYTTIVILLLLGTLRGISVGTDHAGYEPDFYLFSSLQTASKILYHKFEIGYLLCIDLFKKFSNNYTVFSGLTFIPFGICSFVAIKKSQVNYPLALFLFFTLGFYFFGYAAMRQSIAMSFILCALPLLKKRQYKTFALIVILASLGFHKSQIMGLLLIPIHFLTTQQKVFLQKKTMAVLLVVSYLSFFIGQQYLKDFSSSVAILFGMDDYTAYITGMNGEEVNGNLTSTLFTIFALFSLYCKNLNVKSFYFYTYILGTCLFNVSNMMGAQSTRMSTLFFIFIIFAIPEMYYDKQTKFLKIFRPAVFFFCAIYFWKAFINANTYGINPYYLAF